MNLTKGLMLLLAVNTETAVLLLSAWWVGDWLNKHYPKQFSWFVVMYLVAAVAICHSWARLFKFLNRSNKKKGDE